MGRLCEVGAEESEQGVQLHMKIKIRSIGDNRKLPVEQRLELIENFLRELIPVLEVLLTQLEKMNKGGDGS